MTVCVEVNDLQAKPDEAAEIESLVPCETAKTQTIRLKDLDGIIKKPWCCPIVEPKDSADVTACCPRMGKFCCIACMVRLIMFLIMLSARAFHLKLASLYIHKRPLDKDRSRLFALCLSCSYICEPFQVRGRLCLLQGPDWQITWFCLWPTICVPSGGFPLFTTPLHSSPESVSSTSPPPSSCPVSSSRLPSLCCAHDLETKCLLWDALHLCRPVVLVHAVSYILL